MNSSAFDENQNPGALTEAQEPGQTQVKPTQGTLARVMAEVQKAKANPLYVDQVVAIAIAKRVSSTGTYLQTRGTGEAADYMLAGFSAVVSDVKPVVQNIRPLLDGGYTDDQIESMTDADKLGALISLGLTDLPLEEVDLTGMSLQIPDNIEGLPRTGRSSPSLDDFLQAQHGATSTLLIAFDPEVSVQDLSFADGTESTSVILRNAKLVGTADAISLGGSNRTAAERVAANSANLRGSIARRTTGPRSGYPAPTRGVAAKVDMTPNTEAAAAEQTAKDRAALVE